MTSLMKKQEKLSLEGNKIYSGRQLYEAFFISNYNRKPVDDLVTHVKGAVITKDLPLPLDQLLEHLLVDGSFLINDGQFIHGDFVFMDEQNALLKRDGLFHYYFKGDSAVVYSKYEEYDQEKEELSKMVGMVEEFPSESFIFLCNGKGILYQAQKTLLRIESILETMKNTTGMEAMIFIQGGSVNSDVINNRIESELKATRPAMRLAAGEDIKQPNFSSLTNRLFNEFRLLEAAYKEATYQFNITPNESGIARKYSMERFLSKVEDLEQQCMAIYSKLGVEIRFDVSDVTDVEEDQKSMELVEAAKERGYISEEEAKQRVRALLGYVDD